MIELSVTVTAGEGSERHNHDLDYRETLEHVHKREEPIIELIPYEKPYEEQIDDFMRPYIDEYNRKVEERYLAAWERYNSGQIKTKPRKRDYQKMEYDYCDQHRNDTWKNPQTGKQEVMPLFRSLIIGIGDQEDRLSGRITEEQATAILRNLIKRFREEFPDFLVLGVALHLDEEGFYHCHLDYKPTYQKSGNSRELGVGVGFETALEKMGFEPEQSVINGRDKVPLLFNAFRNRIYHIMEQGMAEHNLRLQYGVSEVKEPGKDSSRNQNLDDWKVTQDATRELQHKKNLVLDTIMQDRVSGDDFKRILELSDGITHQLDEIASQPKSRLNKDNVIVHYRLLDQLKSFVMDLMDKIGSLLQRIDILQENLNIADEELEELRPFKKYASEDFQRRQIELEWKAKEYDKIQRAFMEERGGIER